MTRAHATLDVNAAERFFSIFKKNRIAFTRWPLQVCSLLT
jgi:hypothetical protein